MKIINKILKIVVFIVMALLVFSLILTGIYIAYDKGYIFKSSIEEFDTGNSANLLVYDENEECVGWMRGFFITDGIIVTRCLPFSPSKILWAKLDGNDEELLFWKQHNRFNVYFFVLKNRNENFDKIHYRMTVPDVGESVYVNKNADGTVDLQEFKISDYIYDENGELEFLVCDGLAKALRGGAVYDKNNRLVGMITHDDYDTNKCWLVMWKELVEVIAETDHTEGTMTG